MRPYSKKLDNHFNEKREMTKEKIDQRENLLRVLWIKDEVFFEKMKWLIKDINPSVNELEEQAEVIIETNEKIENLASKRTRLQRTEALKASNYDYYA